MLLLLLLLLYLFVVVAAVTPKQTSHSTAMLTVVAAVGAFHFLKSKRNKKSNRRGRGSTKKRMRRSMESIFSEIGRAQVRRMYRMEPDSFWDLCDLLEPYMKERNKRKRGSDPNGPISTEVRIAAALRYFSGGCPLMTLHWLMESTMVR